jgi:hypothetical protein
VDKKPGALQSAINRTDDGGTICFEAGFIYDCEGAGEGATIAGKTLTLTTAPNPSAAHATIDCGGKGRALSMVNANVTLASLHLCNGNAVEGGLLRASGGALRVQDSVLEGGRATCRVWQNTSRSGWDPGSGELPPSAFAKYFAKGCGAGDVPFDPAVCDVPPADDDAAPPSSCGSSTMPAVGGGGALFANGTVVTMVGSTLRGNRADSYGGAVLLSFGFPFIGPPPSYDDDNDAPLPSGPTVDGRAPLFEGNLMEDNEGALTGGAVGAVFWGDSTGSDVRFRHNDVRNCHSSGTGTGAGGIAVLYLGACSLGNAHGITDNSFTSCSGGSGGNYHNSRGGGGAGGFAIVYAGYSSSKVHIVASNNTHVVSGNTFTNCTGGSDTSFSSIGENAAGGGGGGGGFAVIFASNSLGGSSRSDGNILSIENNTLSACTGGSNSSFVTGGAGSGGGGGGGGFAVIFASVTGEDTSSSDNNTLSICNNTLSACTGGSNNSFSQPSGGGYNGGGGGSGGFAVIFANAGYEGSSSDSNTVSIDNNMLSACTGGSNNAFACSKSGVGTVCGSGGGSGGAIVTFSAAGASYASASHTTVSATRNVWHSLGGMAAARCPHPGSLCGTAGALAILFTTPGTAVANTTVTFTDNRVEQCSASGMVDSTNAGSGAAAGITVLYFQTAPVLEHNMHAFERNRFVSNAVPLRGSAMRLLLGSGTSANNASFANNTFMDNTVTCADRQACAGGSVVVDGGHATFYRDYFRGNVGERGAAADLFVTASSTGRLDSHLELANVVFYMTAQTNDLLAPSTTGVTIGKAAAPSHGALFVCPSGYSVTNGTSSAQISFGCQRCAPSTTLTQVGTLDLGADLGDSVCQPCPFGGDCTEGGDATNAVTGYWGSKSPVDGNVSFSLCPSGLCCPAGGCAWNKTCSPLHRDNAVPLCGECEAGYSATVGSSACRATANCNDGKWFLPVLLLLALAWTQLLLVLVAGASSPGGGSYNSQAAEIAQMLLYFYQMVPLLPVGQTQVDEELALVAGIFNMQLHAPSTDGFACPFPGLTTLQEIALHYVMPVLVGGMLLLRYLGQRCARHYTRQDTRCAQGAALHRTGSDRMLSRYSSSTALPLYARSVPSLLAMAFTTLLTTTFKLLTCKRVRGVRVIFCAASVPCDQWWRVPLFLVAGALLLPVVAALLARALPAAARWWTARPWQRKAWAKAVVKKLRAPFVDDCWHWAAVLALQRLVVVAVYSFVVETASRALCQAFVMVCFLVLHVGSRPFVQPAVQLAQTALLGTLVLVALLNAPLAMLQTGAFALPSSNPAGAFQQQLKLVEAILLVVPGASFAAAVLFGLWAAVAHSAARLLRCVVWLCTAPCRSTKRKANGARGGQEQPFGTPLLNPMEEHPAMLGGGGSSSSSSSSSSSGGWC